MAQTTTDLTTTHWSNNDSDSPEVIRARIQQTRANMTEIVNEIQDKLSPERLTAEAKQKIKDATLGKVEEVANMATYKANTWRTQAMETIRQNPIPAALVGIGLGWLLIEGSRSSSSHYSYSSPEYDYNTSRGMRYYSEEKPMMARAQSAISENVSNVQDKAGEMAQNVQHKVGDVADTVQTRASEMAGNLQAKAGEVTSNLQAKAGEVTSNLQAKAGEVTNKVSEQADYLSRQAQHQAERAKMTFQNTLEENPLAVGAVALAAGAAIGLMIPITQKEDELMGETRDRLLQQAQDAAKETFKKVEKGAQEAYHVVKEEVTNDMSTEDRPLEEGMTSTTFRSY